MNVIKTTIITLFLAVGIAELISVGIFGVPIFSVYFGQLFSLPILAGVGVGILVVYWLTKSRKGIVWDHGVSVPLVFLFLFVVFAVALLTFQTG